jgi:hypothetical protein
MSTQSTTNRCLEIDDARAAFRDLMARTANDMLFAIRVCMIAAAARPCEAQENAVDDRARKRCAPFPKGGEGERVIQCGAAICFALLHDE